MADKKELSPEQKIAQLEAELAGKQAELDAQAAIIETQDEQLKAAEIQGAGALPVITHEKVRYQVLAASFIVEGKLVKAEDLKTDKSLVAKLIETGSGVLQVIVEAKAE